MAVGYLSNIQIISKFSTHAQLAFATSDVALTRWETLQRLGWLFQPFGSSRKLIKVIGLFDRRTKIEISEKGTSLVSHQTSFDLKQKGEAFEFRISSKPRRLADQINQKNDEKPSVRSTERQCGREKAVGKQWRQGRIDERKVASRNVSHYRQDPSLTWAVVILLLPFLRNPLHTKPSIPPLRVRRSGIHPPSRSINSPPISTPL
ncbi:hypothetical protein QCA50_019541 [Cerrena zonata]|uniref:Uncharacterized protein n=1 Tax=Cerrena zonata TaxID=2478898 RepID=A0AAW0F931_9APHY